MANAIRALSMDAVQNANSGHPGMPMGMAEIAVALWSQHLKHNPKNPNWFDRDRFVLSNGHGSMLLYSALHLAGYDVSIEDLKQFRQLHSKCPGHPERGYTPGVETTTGPLGQGIANAVGMAIAEKTLAAEFNRPGHTIVDHNTFVFVGDGCLMEGLSHEVCSLAGTLGLSKLIVLYDDNGISIDGHIEGWFTDNTPKRFEAYGWQVIANVDGHDVDAVSRAIQVAKSDTDRPTLICCKTTIGKGSPNKADSHDCHGSPLGKDEVAATRKALGWEYPAFVIPKNIYNLWNGEAKGKATEQQWNSQFESYKKAHPDLAKEFARRMALELPTGFAKLIETSIAELEFTRPTIASRKASLNSIEMLAAELPELIGGSADLASSNLTLWKKASPVTRQSGGNYVYYGVREFGMAAIMNGILVHGGWRPFGGTFLVFSDYARNALRMAALMKLPAVYVFTHDSIALGQDGPTHQPVEHLASLRQIPNMDVWRPCDSLETLIAWSEALGNASMPTCLALSRQDLPYQTRDLTQTADIRRGGYILRAEGGSLSATIVATGSEVQLALEAQRKLVEQGFQTRVVSMPSTTRFDRQDKAYRQSVLGGGVPVVSVEAGITDFWRKYVGRDGHSVGIDTFGESAPPNVLFTHFEVTSDAVCQAVVRACGAKEA